MPFEYTIRTRYAETAQDGIIHHSSFILYLEEARIAYVEMLGYYINELEKKKICCPIVDLSIKYKKPLHSLEDITIQVWIKSFTKMRFELCYQIIHKQIVIATASTTSCFINEFFKPIPFFADFLETLKKANPGKNQKNA